LSELVGLGLVLDNKSVEVARTSNLELDRVSVLLDASGYNQKVSTLPSLLVSRIDLHWASFLRAISRNCLISLIC